jgi:hypothetical protein
MYTCERALVRRYGVNQRLIETQVNHAPLRELLTDYAVVHLILSNPVFATEVSLNLADVSDIIFKLNPSTTVDAWLEANGNKTLPISETVVKATAGVVKYRDLLVAKYDVQKVHPWSGDGNLLLDAELTDLRVTREGCDYKELYEHGLFTVNGLCHITDYSSRGVVIKGGGRSIHYANRNQLGLHSFLSVGKMSFHPITDEMIRPIGKDSMNNDYPLRRGVLLSMPDIDLTDKVVLISMMGILHFNNEKYSVRGDHDIMLEWWKLPLMDMFYNVKPFIDMSSVEEHLDTPSIHGDAMDMNRVNSDAAVRAILKLPQSFIILLEAENFFCDRIGLEQTGLAGRYTYHAQPKYPLQLENGFLPEYVSYDDHGEFVISIDKNLVNRWAHDTRPYAKEDNYVNSARESSFPTFYASAYLLEMGTEYIEQ